MKYIVGEVDFRVKKHIFEPQRSINECEGSLVSSPVQTQNEMRQDKVFFVIFANRSTFTVKK